MSTQEVKDKSVSVLLLRLQHREILVPKAMVADVLSWNENLYCSPKRQVNQWKLGEYSWNDWQVPLICFESLIDADFEAEEVLKRKVIVLKACQKGFENEHYALQCRGFPKPLILSEQSLENLDIDDDQEWISYSISIGSRVLDVPNFSTLEDTIWSMPESIADRA